MKARYLRTKHSLISYIQDVNVTPQETFCRRSVKFSAIKLIARQCRSELQHPANAPPLPPTLSPYQIFPSAQSHHRSASKGKENAPAKEYLSFLSSNFHNSSQYLLLLQLTLWRQVPRGTEPDTLRPLRSVLGGVWAPLSQMTFTPSHFYLNYVV